MPADKPTKFANRHGVLRHGATIVQGVDAIKVLSHPTAPLPLRLEVGVGVW